MTPKQIKKLLVKSAKETVRLKNLLVDACVHPKSKRYLQHDYEDELTYIYCRDCNKCLGVPGVTHYDT